MKPDRRLAPERKRTDLLGLRVTAFEYALVRAVAEARGCTIAAVMREAILTGPHAPVRELRRSA